MSARIAGLVWELDLPATDKMVLLKLAGSAWDDGSNASPEVQEIADVCGLGRRSVSRILAKLKACKLIAEEAPADRAKHRPARYKVFPERGTLLDRYRKEAAPAASNGKIPGDSVAPGAEIPGAKLAPGGKIPGDSVAPGAEIPGATESPGGTAPGAKLAPGRVPQSHPATPPIKETIKNIYISDSEKQAGKDPKFDRFWSIMPHQPNDPKTKGREVWAARLAAGADADRLIEAAKGYKAWAEEASSHWVRQTWRWLIEECDASVDLSAGKAKGGSREDWKPPGLKTPSCPQHGAAAWRSVQASVVAEKGAGVCRAWFAALVFDGAVLHAPSEFARDRVVGQYDLYLKMLAAKAEVDAVVVAVSPEICKTGEGA